MKKFLIGGGFFLILFTICIVFSYINGSYYVNACKVESIDTFDDYLSGYIKTNGVFIDPELNEKFVKYSVDTTAIQNMNTFDKVLSKIKNTNFTLPVTYEIDEVGLKSYIDEYNKTLSDAKNAEIVRGKKKFKIIKEEDGTKIDFNKLLKATKETNQININDYYVEPTVYESDLTEELDRINKFVNWYVTYKKKASVRASIDNVDYNSETGEVTLNYDFIREQVKSNVLPKYNTVGQTRKFKTHSKKKIKVSGGTFGTIVDEDAEVKKLTKLFKKAKSKTKREPILSLNLKDIGDTYIEVSKSAQHLWVYKNGKCIKDSPVVTGNPNKGHSTPSGVFYVSEKVPGKYLVGDNYRTWVNRWMRLTNTGIGLHDANWRGVFGGQIYRSNGSHGCINLQPSFANWLYSHTEWKIPVIVY